MSPLWLELLVGVQFISVACALRNGVLITGTTVGPGFNRNEGKARPTCPTSEPHPIENGKYCCKFFTSASNERILLTTSSPLSDCASYVECLDVEKSGYGCKQPKLANLTSCPQEHPFAMNSGKICCKFHRQKNSTAQCNGEHVTESDPLECCREDQFVPCPGKVHLCENHIGAKAYCGKSPIFTRYGDRGVYLNPTSYDTFETKTKCQEVNGSLPTLRDIEEWEALQKYFVEEGYKVAVFGLQVVPGMSGARCEGAACSASYRYMDDNQPFAYQPWMEGRFQLDLTGTVGDCTNLKPVDNLLVVVKRICVPLVKNSGLCLFHRCA